MDLINEIYIINNTAKVGDIYIITEADSDRTRSIGTKVKVKNSTNKDKIRCKLKFCDKTSPISCIEFSNIDNPSDTIWNCYCQAELIRRVDD